MADAVADLLRPLQKPLAVGSASPTVIMVVGVNGAGKTTTSASSRAIWPAADRKVLLAAADTFRAAAREQLAVWADRNRAVEIVSQEGGDPAAVTFDAVTAGRARGCDVVIADTAGRLPTQLHLMEELKKIHRVIGKAQEGAPHEVLLVVDGNTGQNALSQVQAFDAALGTRTGADRHQARRHGQGRRAGGLALWSRTRPPRCRCMLIGIGEKLEDLQLLDVTGIRGRRCWADQCAVSWLFGRLERCRARIDSSYHVDGAVRALRESSWCVESREIRGGRGAHH